jgi:hypothetical protein
MSTTEVAVNEETVENSTAKTNVSADQWEAKRIQSILEGPTPVKAKGVDPEEFEIQPDPDDQDELDDEDEEGSTDVLSKINLEGLSDQELSALREKLIPGAEKRIHELTAKRKSAEENFAAYQAKNPLDQPDEIKENPFSDLESIEDLQVKFKESKQIFKWADDLLDDNGFANPDDVIYSEGNKEFTKAQIKKAKREADEAMELYLPNRLQSIQGKQAAEQIKEQLISRAKADLGWMQDENSETYKKYSAELEGPMYKKLIESAPADVAAYLPYIIAHAANSLHGGDKPKQQKEKKPVERESEAIMPNEMRTEPPRSQQPATAAPRKLNANRTKAIEELHQRYKKTGNPDDWDKWQLARHS